MYRVGFPGWKFAARHGIPMIVRIDVHYDPEVKSFWTTSPDLPGLVVTGSSLDELMRQAKHGIEDLMDMELKGRAIHAAPRLSFSQDALCAA
jgi:predicted RNase H-like HicB family nuclease